MVRHVLKVPKGEWLLQSAAGSTLGKMIIKLGRHDGFKTLNVVRRSRGQGRACPAGRRRGDQLLRRSDRRAGQARSPAATASRYALDPVGGETGTGVFRSLAPGGRLVVYGTLSGEPIQARPPAT